MYFPCSDRIKNLRKEKGQTQKRIASVLGLSQRVYSDYENGTVRIPVRVLVCLAVYYDVSLDYLSGVSNIRRSRPLH
jgi:transcriptional regulator with XRE-family HTH domain